MGRNKRNRSTIARSLKNSRLVADSKGKVAKAVRWRLNAYEQEPSIMNLVRPIPSNSGTFKSEANVRSSAKSVSNQKPAQYRFRWGSEFYNTPVRDNVVFYESFSGNGTLCNPWAIFNELLSDPDMSHLEHVWSIKDENARREFNTRYAKHGNVRAVRYETDIYWKEICTAKYLFNNATFPPYFTKRPEQVYVNMWHGTPLKKMGYHSNEGANGARNIIRNFVQADYFVSPNSFTTETMFKDAYKMDNIFEGTIIEQGYPRIDAQFASEARKSQIKSFLSDQGVKLSGKPLVLYAPTWKGASFHRPTNDAKELHERVRFLQSQVGGQFDILLKVHQQVYRFAKDDMTLSPVLVPNSFQTNEILSITDILITDYSSIFFDYLATEKPVIFFTPDKLNYSDLRGLYLNSLPGPSTQKIEEVAELLTEYSSSTDSLLGKGFAAARMEAKADFSSQDDGSAAKRVVDIVLRGNPDSLETKNLERSKKEKILLYLGGMRNNGITTSALNLLNNIDFNRFDVSIWAPQPSKDSPAFLYERIPAEVRQFLRIGTHPLTSELNDELNSFLGLSEFNEASIPSSAQSVFQTEWRRCFGSSTFDYIVDFSGYAGYWSFVLLQGNATKSMSVWQHNDLINDRDRTVNGKKPNFVSLSSQFNAYRFFDNIVSVSEDLKNLNRNNLSEFAPVERFKYCHNTVDSKKVARALSGKETELDGVFNSENISAEQVLDYLLKFKGKLNLLEMVEDRALRQQIFAKHGVRRFVSAGRMSPEKNQARLIRAFAMVHELHPDTELLLLGDGALRSDLESLAEELQISDSVIFAGMVKNALPLMKDCDCFVLSSDYEGQPMVILEASSLGLPVVTVSFASVKNSLDDTRGIVVNQDEASLAAGMCDFLEGRMVSNVEFDYESYNLKIMKEFYSAIGAE